LLPGVDIAFYPRRAARRCDAATKRVHLAAIGLAGLLAAISPSRARVPVSGVDRLYVLDCGSAHAPDQSHWSPGVNVGKPIDISDNCYLIHHTTGGYILWDTGIGDEVAAMPNGRKQLLTWFLAKTLVGQLDQIGVKPAQIRFVGISHMHRDHLGNVSLFPNATLIVQKPDYDAILSSANPAFNAGHPAQVLTGDKDLFGDGSVTVLFTPGHTAGHQSLLVHLPKTGWVVLSGDAVHFKDNWDNRRVPADNVDKEKTLTSMQRIAGILAEHKAQLWINHDAAQSAQQKHAPEYYE
jgi:N-acyl homoserine lactone hydrolase